MEKFVRNIVAERINTLVISAAVELLRRLGKDAAYTKNSMLTSTAGSFRTTLASLRIWGRSKINYERLWDVRPKAEDGSSGEASSCLARMGWLASVVGSAVS